MDGLILSTQAPTNQWRMSLFKVHAMLNVLFFFLEMMLMIWKHGENKSKNSYSILTKNSAEDGIGSICTTCPDHICWVYVFDICWDTNLLETPFDL